MSPHDLPQGLKAAIAAEVEGATAVLRAGTLALTRAYKAGGRSEESMDFSAYLAARLPATYAAVSKVLSEVHDRIEGFAPASLIDVGSGPGTASWAAVEAFSSLREIAFVDSNRSFLDLALRLARESGDAALRSARGHHADMAAVPLRADLAIAAYALAEVSEPRAAQIVTHLWGQSGQTLILIEPGTPAGFARLKAARTALRALGANIAAPCPPTSTCPMEGTDWCHFSVRLSRSRVHMQAKGATVPFEDERFAYLVATRLPVIPAPTRILSPTSLGKPGVTLRLCTPAGVEVRTVAKREGQAFKRAKKADWGDAYE